MSQSTLFRRGIPTDADIKILREHFPDSTLYQGKEIPYSEIERLLHSTRRQHRFVTVTQRWRAIIERESCIFTKCVAGEKFVVCSEADKAELSTLKSREAAKKARRAVFISNHVDRKSLSEDQLKRFDASTLFAAAIIGINAVKKPQSLPTI